MNQILATRGNQQQDLVQTRQNQAVEAGTNQALAGNEGSIWFEIKQARKIKGRKTSVSEWKKLIICRHFKTEVSPNSLRK